MVFPMSRNVLPISGSHFPNNGKLFVILGSLCHILAGLYVMLGKYWLNPNLRLGNPVFRQERVHSPFKKRTPEALIKTPDWK
jgi:hypothetical protein